MKAQSGALASLQSFVIVQIAWLLGSALRLEALDYLSGIFKRRAGPSGRLGAGGVGPQPEGPYAALVAEHTSDLIALLDERGRYRYVSASHLRSLGYDAAEMIGERCMGFVHPEDQPCAVAHWQEARTGGSASLVCRVSRRDGSWRWVDVRMERPRAAGDLLLLVGRDITEQRELAQRLMLTQRTLAIGTLASSIVHDINNVLLVIEGSATLAADTLSTDSPAQEDLEAILTASRHGGDLTRRLLSFVRQHPVGTASADIGAIISAILPLVVRLCTRQIAVSADIAPGLWPIAAERSQIEQVLINLAANARDAMPDGGRLLVRACNEGEAWVRVEVADSGTGMDAEVLRRAFEPFYTTKAPGRGSGLGLFTSRHIIGELGGTLTAQSIPGAGTTFTIRLPRHRG